mgnify:CR=1 FL=1
MVANFLEPWTRGTMSGKHVCSKSTTVGYAAAAFVAGVGTAALARFLYKRATATQSRGDTMTTEAFTTGIHAPHALHAVTHS